MDALFEDFEYENVFVKDENEREFLQRLFSDAKVVILKGYQDRTTNTERSANRSNRSKGRSKM